jgi:hypothetical protein
MDFPYGFSPLKSKGTRVAVRDSHPYWTADR